MNGSEPYVITISRMLGSGGMVIGKQLAEKLNIAYFDKEILSSAAEVLGFQEADLENYDEKTTPIWDLLLKSSAWENTDVYLEPRLSFPTNRQLYETEASIIKSIASERSAVIVGRGASYILRDHPRHISIFLHCDADLRSKRIQDLSHISEKDAIKMIKESDSKRSHFQKQFTGRDWADVREYTLSFDTGKISLDCCIEIISRYAQSRFGTTQIE